MQNWFWMWGALLLLHKWGIGLGICFAIGSILPDSSDPLYGLSYHDFIADFEHYAIHSSGLPFDSHGNPEPGQTSFNQPEPAMQVQRQEFISQLNPVTQSPEFQLYPNRIVQSSFLDHQQDHLRAKTVQLPSPCDQSDLAMPISKPSTHHMDQHTTSSDHTLPVNQIWPEVAPTDLQQTQSPSSLFSHNLYILPSIDNSHQSPSNNKHISHYNQELASTHVEPEALLMLNSGSSSQGSEPSTNHLSEENKKQLSAVNKINPSKRKKINPAAEEKIDLDYHSQTNIFPQDAIMSKHYDKFAYDLVDFEPENIYGKIVVSIVNDFRLDDGTKFFNLPTYIHPHTQDQVTKMFCIRPSSPDTPNGVDKLFALFSELSVKFKQNTNGGPKNSPKVSNYVYARLVADSKETFVDYEIFKQAVNTDYKQLILNFEQKLSDSPWPNYASKQAQNFQFERAMKVFPMYMLYVDLISVLIPIENLDKEGELLARQQETAANMFFKFLEDTMLNDKQMIAKDPLDKVDSARCATTNEMIHVFKSKKGLVNDKRMPFTWFALQFWMLSSRKDLVTINDYKVLSFDRSDVLKRNVKIFFNYLAFSWLQSHTMKNQ